MDFSESTKIVSSRIQEIEPEYASKIVGYLLLKVSGGQDMIRLAFCPDNVIKTVINNVKHILGLNHQQQQQQLVYAPPPIISPIQINAYHPPPSPINNACWSIQVANGLQDVNVSMPEGYGLEDQFQQFLSLNNHNHNHLDSEVYNNNHLCSYSDEPVLDVVLDGFINKPRGASRRSNSLTEFPPKICHYFTKGFCKHGNACRYFHGSPRMAVSESFSHEYGNGNGDFGNVLSLKKLEIELTELLRSRKGSPISIASLPTLYREMYGKPLQGEGYPGNGLAKLLARMKNSICLIDRPHGQHSVILAEDASKYLYANASDQTEHGGIVPGSRQIYLTFPAESTFTENDVSNYFNTYGPVHDVRIPGQLKRMYGFVTFVHTETVRKILARGNPHFVCGSRVLVKPYREKSRVNDRKNAEKSQQFMHYRSQSFDDELEYNYVPRASDIPRQMRRQFMEDRSEELEVERWHISESQLLPYPSTRLPFLANSIDQFRLAEEFPPSERLNFGLDGLVNVSSSEERLRIVTTNDNDQDSNPVLNLPDSPFATSTANNST